MWPGFFIIWYYFITRTTSTIPKALYHFLFKKPLLTNPL